MVRRGAISAAIAALLLAGRVDIHGAEHGHIDVAALEVEPR